MISNIFTILPIISFMSYLIIGFYVFILNPKSELNRNFLYSCFSFALWSFGYIFINMDPNSHYLNIWQKLGHLGAIIYVPFIFKFILILTKYYNKIKYKVIFNIIIWIFPAILAYKNLIDNSIVNDIPYGWFFIKEFLNIYNLLNILLIISWGLKTKSKREKKQAITIIIGAISTVILALASDYYLELHHINTFASSIVSIWIISVWLAIVKYRFLTLTPNYVSNNIIQNIDEAIILLNQNKDVIFANEKAKSMIGIDNFNKEAMVEKIKNFHYIDNKISELLNEKSNEIYERLHVSVNENKNILIDIKCSIIKDKFNDTLGILIIGKEVKGAEHFKRIHKLTEREFNIILQIISGATNKEIGDDLGITLNTIKRHITNIYNKLVINNKVELMNILKDYEII